MVPAKMDLRIVALGLVAAGLPPATIGRKGGGVEPGRHQASIANMTTWERLWT